MVDQTERIIFMTSSDNLTLAGRRAVVTGAGRGIGRSIALALARAGADVAVTARTHVEIEQLVAEIRATGRRSLAIPSDVTDSGQVNQMATALIEGFGGVDILVNNAGNAASHKFLNHPDELWHRMLAVNLPTVSSVTKAFPPSPLNHPSSLIFLIASTSP